MVFPVEDVFQGSGSVPREKERDTFGNIDGDKSKRFSLVPIRNRYP
jgi:hypothetical protein